jgi:hypothetical protein
VSRLDHKSATKYPATKQNTARCRRLIWSLPISHPARITHRACYPCPEGALDRRQGGRPRPLLSLSFGCGRTSWRRAGARPNANRNRARHETDGLHRDRPALARQSAVQMNRIQSAKFSQRPDRGTVPDYKFECPSMAISRPSILRRLSRYVRWGGTLECRTSIVSTVTDAAKRVSCL